MILNNFLKHRQIGIPGTRSTEPFVTKVPGGAYTILEKQI